MCRVLESGDRSYCSVFYVEERGEGFERARGKSTVSNVRAIISYLFKVRSSAAIFIILHLDKMLSVLPEKPCFDAQARCRACAAPRVLIDVCACRDCA